MIIYQTVEDRKNPEEIEHDAPYICDADNAWLGKGYYFWDTLIENAHWWGRSHYHYTGYVVIEFNCDSINDGKCYDLHGNMEHLSHFNKYIEILKEQSLFSEEETVAKVISFLKDKTDFLNRFEAIRAYGHNSKKNPKFVLFDKEKKKYGLEQFPAVQLCLFKNNSLNLKGGKIVFPESYCTEYII